VQHPHANVQIAMVGDAQIGKTSLMVKYVEGLFSQDYIQSLGIENLTMIFFAL
jgi:GTP-binding protein of the ras superfamily involved in termination of M-phase